MKLVVDRQAHVDTVLLGFGEPGDDNPVPLELARAFTASAAAAATSTRPSSCWPRPATRTA